MKSQPNVQENNASVDQNNLAAEEIPTDSNENERSPATQRKMSDRASEYALIQYLSRLVKIKSAVKSFDFTFVEFLLENGADINTCDVIGQSAFHIVAKFWSIDVARFLLDHGADIDAQDCLGRSPLHEASALDYVDMVEFLVQNGANINIETYSQEQRPIHFAAKNDSCQTLTVLLAYGADINSLDSKKRTPLQVAAEMNRSKAAEMLINEGASAVIYDDDGNSALNLLTEKLPDVALMALDQLHSVDSVSRKEFFSLNRLEGPKVKEEGEFAARTPLEIAVQNRRFSIIMHPLVQRLIDVKWDIYGKWGAVSNLMFNLVYVVLWSIFSIMLNYKSHEMYTPLETRGWRLGIVIAIIIVTAEEIRKQIADTLRVRQQHKYWVEWRAHTLEEDLAYCHPGYPTEWKYLVDEIKSLRNRSYLSTGDGWVYVDWVALLLVTTAIITHVIFLKCETILAYKIHRVILILLLLILWIRMLKYARPFQALGPIVVIFANIVQDSFKCAFLFAILFHPYLCAFWLIYGSNSPNPVSGYSNMFDLYYNMICMIVGIDFPFEGLLEVDPFMARALCSSFIISMAIILINLLIALLSDTFTRLYSNAVANAIMQRAQCILVIERTMGKRRRKEYYKYVRDNCSPMVISMDHERARKHKQDKTQNLDHIIQEIKEIKIVITNIKRKSSHGEAGHQTHVSGIHPTNGLVLKQNQQIMVKLNKIFSMLAVQKGTEMKPSESLARESLVERNSVVSSLPERPEGLEEEPSSEPDEDVSFCVPVNERQNKLLPVQDDVIPLRPIPKTTLRDLGQDNKGFVHNEDTEPRLRRCTSETPASREHVSRLNMRRRIVHFPCGVLPPKHSQRLSQCGRNISTTSTSGENVGRFNVRRSAVHFPCGLFPHRHSRRLSQRERKVSTASISDESVSTLNVNRSTIHFPRDVLSQALPQSFIQLKRKPSSTSSVSL